MMNRQSVINLAVRKWKKNTEIDVEIMDCLIWSMEEHDTDDMTQFEFDALLNDVKGMI